MNRLAIIAIAVVLTGCTTVRITTPRMTAVARVGRDATVVMVVRGDACSVTTVSRASPELVKSVVEGAAQGIVQGFKGGL